MNIVAHHVVADVKIMIGTNEKEVNFKDVYTRKMDREYNAILFKGVESTTNSKGETDFKIIPTNIHEANDLLIVSITNITKLELDEMSIKDYDTVLEMAQALKTPSK